MTAASGAGATLDARVAEALAITPASSAAARTVDVTTTGAKTGRPRRIEIWFYRVDGVVYLTTQPAVRGWYANLLAHPSFTFHLKNGVRADLAATAVPVRDDATRGTVFTAIVEDLDHPRHRAYLAQPVEPVEEWMAGSPLVRVDFERPSRSLSSRTPEAHPFNPVSVTPSTK